MQRATIEPLTVVDLFSGIGGFAIPAHHLGFETVAFCEQDAFCQRVLRKHFPGVPIHDDIKTTDFSRYAGADLVCGGPPCQSVSLAGKREGTRDPRFLWPDFLRAVREVDPIWILAENPIGLLSHDGGRTFGAIVREMAEMGFSVGWCVYGAAHVGAPHLRKRVFIVAKSRSRTHRIIRGVYADASRGEPGRQEPWAERVRTRKVRESEPTVQNCDNGGQRQPKERAEQQGRAETIGSRFVGSELPSEINADSQSISERPGLCTDRSGGRRRRRSCDCGCERDGGCGIALPALDIPLHGIPGTLVGEFRLDAWRDGWDDGIPPVSVGVPERAAKIHALGNAVSPVQAWVPLMAIAEVLRATEKSSPTFAPGCVF